jgi:hypothetical protein
MASDHPLVFEELLYLGRFESHQFAQANDWQPRLLACSVISNPGSGHAKPLGHVPRRQKQFGRREPPTLQSVPL